MNSISKMALYWALIVMFAVSTSVEHGMQVPALLILLYVLIGFGVRFIEPGPLFQLDYLVWLGLSLPFVSPLITMAMFQEWTLSELDNPSRYLAAMLFYLAVRSASFQNSLLQWSFAAGAICCFGMAIHEVGWLGEGGRAGGALRQPISFGNIAILFGVLCLVFAWSALTRWLIYALTAAGAMGVMASIYSQSRGGWLLLLFFPLVVPVFWRYVPSVKRTLFFLMLFGAVAVFIYVFLPSVTNRLTSAAQGVECWLLEGIVCEGGVSVRLEMFTVAFHYFWDAPFWGHGLNVASQMIERAKSEGLIDPAVHAYGHLHNDFLELLLNSGLVGLGFFVSHLAIFGWIAIRLIVKARVIEDAQAGAALFFAVLGQVVMGMSQVMLGHATTATFYAMLLAICGGVVVNRLVSIEQKFIVAEKSAPRTCR